MGAVPLGPPPTPAPAAPVSASGNTPATSGGSSGPGVHAASTTPSQAGAAAPAPIPVSAARAERDFIAQATSAAAARRKSAANDPLALARRIAAALNAPDRPGKNDWNFFWVTAVTADGQIIVANSYGMAYIPDGLNLPEPVRLVSADDAIPAIERARWTTYPFSAIHGWRAHHDVELRAVIATEQQFEGVDPGAPKVVLTDDDLPETGKMAGRNRLEVVAPTAAAQLALVSDWNIVDGLPPPPVDASPPADQRDALWENVNKPMMSTASDRGLAQLQRFAIYAAHAEELALHEAYAGIHAVAQRKAVTDWNYWRYLRILLSDVLAGKAA